MKGNRKNMKNSMRRGCSRILAGLMCLCMMLTLFGASAPVLADEYNYKVDPNMYVYVTHWHTDGKKDTIKVTMSSDGAPKIDSEVGSEDERISYDSGKKQITVFADPDDGERFTAFSLTAGQDAAKINPAVTGSTSGESKESTVTVTYDPNVHLSKILVFYSSSKDKVAGVEFGTVKLPEIDDPEIDTASMEWSKFETKR